MLRKMAAVVIGSGLLASCGGSDIDSDEAAASVAQHMQDRSHAAAGAPPVFDSFDDLLPNVTFAYPDGTRAPLTELFVIGEVTDVADGRAWEVNTPGGDGTETTWDDPDVLWRSYEVTVAVTDSFGPASRPEVIRFGASMDATIDPDLARTGLASLGQVALPLTRSAVYAYDPDLFAVVGVAGEYVGVVASDGTLSFPFVEPATARALGPASIGELRAQGRGQGRTVQA